MAEKGQVYFLPASRFPLREIESIKVKQFIVMLTHSYTKLTETKQFECFAILHSILKFDLINRLAANMFDWRPMQALALHMNLPPPHMLTEKEGLLLLENGSIEKLHEIIPIISYVIREGAVAKAFDSLFGFGGGVLYLSALTGKEFLKISKTVFGHNIKEPAYQFMDCLPIFSIETLLEATTKQFMALNAVLGLYVGESIKDEGVIIISDRSLDREISSLTYLLKDQEADC